jgi:hypothetical protein
MMIEAVKWVISHGTELLAAVNALLAAGIAVALLIPGEQPEKLFRAVAEFLEKFSKKPKALEAPPEGEK